MKGHNTAGGLTVALFFGLFQGLMPLGGFFLGCRFSEYISTYSHIAAFVLLGLIGGKMIYEAFQIRNDDAESTPNQLNIGELLLLAIATSIDALTVGILFAADNAPPFRQCGFIAAVAFVLSYIGYIIGSRFGNRFENKAEIAGGAVLILIGIKMLIRYFSPN